MELGHQASPAIARQSKQRSFGLDVARALAAFGVLVTHVAFATGIVNPQRWSSPLRVLLPRLDVGVIFFFVMSGFLVGRPFVKRYLQGAPNQSTRGYAVRRGSRIFPLYWVILAVTLITTYSASFAGGRPSGGEFLADLLLVHIYVPKWAIGPITQSWTLATEIAFYVFLPLWFLALRKLTNGSRHRSPQDRARYLALGLIGWVAVALIYRGAVVAFTEQFSFTTPGMVDTRGALLTWLPNHLDAFAIGVGCALALEAGWARALTVSQRLGTYAVAAAALWIASNHLGLGPAFTGFDGLQTHARHLLFLVCATGFVVPSILATSSQLGNDQKVVTEPNSLSDSKHERVPWAPPVSVAKVATGAALVSYGLYLWHQWVTQEWFSTQRLIDFQASFPTALLVVALGSTVLGAITYWFVEKPATVLAVGRRGAAEHAPRTLRAQPQLDGLRGLAIAAVLATHIVFIDRDLDPWSLKGGFLGVDVFIVLSAFLIGSVLLAELDRRRAAKELDPNINLASFGRRRARRLYPPLIAFLVIEGAIAVILGTKVGEQLFQSFLALTFTANWQLSWGHQPPFELVHLWSLALEAQFYLLMAIGAVWLRHKLRRPDRLVAGLAIAAILVALWRLYLYQKGANLEALYERTDTRADSMFLGVAAALVWRSKLIGDNTLRRIGAASAVLLGFALIWMTPDSPWLFSGGFTVIAAAAAAMVAAGATGVGSVALVGNWKPLRWLGGISYSLYLWHLPIYIWTNRAIPDSPPLVRVGIAVCGAVLAGWLSFKLIESRFLAAWRRTTADSGEPVDQSHSAEQTTPLDADSTT